MATLGATKTAIARRLLDDSNTAITLVEIATAINEAIRHWKHKRFWFNTTSGTVSLAAADTTITLPSDFLIDVPRNALTITQNGFPYRVRKVSPVIFDLYMNTETTGRPQVYCYRNGALEISPYADQTYSGSLYYIKDYTDFETDTSQDSLTNDFLTHGLSLIQNQSLAWLHGELRQDEKMEKRYADRANSAYNALLGRTNMLLRTGTLAVEEIGA